ncbi:hypothetical protein FRC20_006352 [Serendipita sp. 405]|nr:hypothetical protein FRC15_009373 [Serendipita sp. 397]KAG8878675.1 hypothetical protein FRC20_006352 [Serendipita sp. 405]
MTTKPPTQEMSEATPPPKTAEVERSIASQACERCHSPITGQYVRAMGTVYHVDCFRCIIQSKYPFARYAMALASSEMSRAYSYIPQSVP